MLRQERNNAVRLQKMTRDRLRIQQFPLIIRSTLHTAIIANNHRDPPTGTPDSSVDS
jgi:hypothetical protein